MSELKDILQLVTNGGAVVMLVLVAVGLYRVARDIVPAILKWLAEDTAAKTGMVAKLSALEVKVDTAGAGMTRAADQATAAIGQVREAVSAESFELATRVDQAERRITAAVRREQASDPPVSNTAPPAGRRAPVRVGAAI